MRYLYLTTDTLEAETLIENKRFDQKPKHKYYDFEFQDGINLAKRIGFNPMASVEINSKVSEKGLDVIATKLVKKGLYVATETDGKIQKYIPHEAKEREEMVKLALQKKQYLGFGNTLTFSLIWYSNHPNKIRDFELF